MVDSLTDVMPAAISYLNRSVVDTQHRLRIGTQPFDFTVIPGDDPKGSVRSPALRRALRRGVSAVVNVTSWGYHEYPIASLKQAISNGRAVKAFLAQHREVEIERLGDWTPIVGDACPWLITLVNKADLWWDRKDEVLEHYRKGPYAGAVAGQTRMRHVVLGYSAVFHRFFERVALCGTFDDAERMRSRADFLKVLVDVCGKSKAS